MLGILSRRADALVQQIGAEIPRGSDFAARPWEQIVVVAEVDRQRRLFGYCFWGDDWEAATPDGFTTLMLFGALQQAMAGAGTERWKKALARIDRATGRIDVDFDYAGDRWTPDMADPEGFARSLR